MKSKATAVILAAGEGTRMRGTLGTPKPLARINHEPLLLRNLRQLHENGVENIVLVTGYQAEAVEKCARELFPETRFIRNEHYRKDRNILSAILGLREVKAGSGALLIEGDVVFSDSAIARLITGIDSDSNYWSACGLFKTGQKGGIIRAENGSIREIRYERWSSQFADWYKNLGAMHIGQDYVSVFAELAGRYGLMNSNQYFMAPWMENLDLLPSFLLDLGDEACSFNTPAEYEAAASRFTVERPSMSVDLVEVANLRHVEDFDRGRAEWLAKKIVEDGVWTAPLAVSQENIVMDGQHRLEAARLLNLRKIPVVKFEYRDVPVYSLRPGLSLDVDSVLRKVAGGGIYPYKTVKHGLPTLPECRIPLAALGLEARGR